MTDNVPTETVEDKKQYVGIFNPAFGFDFTTLVQILVRSGVLNSPVFHDRDANGNLVNEAGGIVIPANVARHYQIVEIKR